MIQNRKILILGSYGSGKTTFSIELGKLLNVPVFHLDSFFWAPGWKPPELSKWTDIINKIVEGDTWIIDGNYIKTIDIRIQSCDLIVYLNINHWICFYRVVKRTLLNIGKKRNEMPLGCNERINLKLFVSVLQFNSKTELLIFSHIDRLKCMNKLVIYNKGAEDFFVKYLK